MNIQDTCGRCRFSVPIEDAPSSPGDKGDEKPVFCKRYPPQMLVIPVQPKQSLLQSGSQQIALTQRGFFPAMMSAEWCGEFQAEITEETKDPEHQPGFDQDRRLGDIPDDGTPKPFQSRP